MLTRLRLSSGLTSDVLAGEYFLTLTEEMTRAVEKFEAYEIASNPGMLDKLLEVIAETVLQAIPSLLHKEVNEYLMRLPQAAREV